MRLTRHLSSFHYCMLLPLHLPLPGLRAASTLNIQRPSSVRFIPPPSASAVVDATAWRAAAAAHRQRVLHLTGGALAAPSSSESSAAVERASQANKERAAGLTRASHPVYNFLFTYYAFDPHLLLRFSPGLGRTLRGVSVDEPLLYTGRGWVAHPNGGSGAMDARLCKTGVRRSARVAAEVMRRSSVRAPHLNCYGLHEWAMLYAPDAATATPNKHQSLPLRLSQAELNAVVEGQPIACTHFDAFRFFTPDAAPLNTVQPQPSRETQPALEQPGCVHAVMDLFRYAVKLWPYIPSPLLADAFELAVDARVLDMRASPYDLSEYHAQPADATRSSEAADGGSGVFDLSPVRIETAAGRREYQEQQAALAARSQPVRRRLIEAYQEAIDVWDKDELEADG